MQDSETIEKLAGAIRRIYIADPANAEDQIERYLAQAFSKLPEPEKKALLEKTAAVFKGPAANGPALGADALDGIFSMLLGRDVCREDLSPEDMLVRMADSLNAIFDMLNHLISVIDQTLFGESSGDETIRQFIGSHMAGHDRSGSLESYIGRINKAFLTTQEAFKQAAESKLGEVLETLAPEQINARVGGSLKFGPLRKADAFDVYEAEYRKIRAWFESGRFREQLVREFEKKCRGIHCQEGRPAM